MITESRFSNHTIKMSLSYYVLKEIISFVTNTDDILKMIASCCRLRDAAAASRLLHDKGMIKQLVGGDATTYLHLLKCPGYDPAACDNYAIQYAANVADIRVVEALINNKRVDPSALVCFALTNAAMHGRLDVVKRLVQLDCIRKNARFQYAARLATEAGHFEVVGFLVQNGFVDIIGIAKYVFVESCRFGRLDVAEVFVENDEYGLETRDYWNALFATSQTNERDIVEYLLGHERLASIFANSTEYCNISSTIGYGWISLLELFLKNKNTYSPDYSMHSAIKHAAKMGFIDVIRILIDHELITSKNEIAIILYYATKRKDNELKELIMSYKIPKRH